MAIRTYDVVDYANIPPGRWSIGPLKAVQITLTPAEIRSLNSFPVDIVVPANANTFLAPGQCVFVGAQGSGAYSSAPQPKLQYTGNPLNLASLDGSTSWDGSIPAASLAPYSFTAMAGSSTPFDLINGGSASILGLALQITSGGDVTGGDAPCTIDLIYREYTLTGLL